MPKPLPPPTLVSGALRLPQPLPYRGPPVPFEMDWDEAIDLHRRELTDERRRRAQPWTEAELMAAAARCTADAIALLAPEVDLLDAGGLDEDDPVRAAARRFEGCELEGALVLPVEWVADAAPPALVAPPRLRDRRVHRQRWRAAQSLTSKPVKLSLLGPLTLAAAVEDRLFGGNRAACADAFAEALNPALRDLAAAGCPAVEIVEPLLATEGAVAEAELEALARLLHKVPADTARWLRLVAGDAVPAWAGAAPATRLDTALAFAEDLPFDGVVLEPEPALAEAGPVAQWRRLRIALLVMPPDAAGEAAVERGIGWLGDAAARLEPDRLVAAIDGGGTRATSRLAVRLEALQRTVRGFVG